MLGANQIWMTCEKTHDLVHKYDHYLHGSDLERRVVLDRNQLQQLECDDNICVFSRTELLEDFLRTFRSECNIAAKYQQPVLLLVFAHGQDATHDIFIGE